MLSRVRDIPVFCNKPNVRVSIDISIYPSPIFLVSVSIDGTRSFAPRNPWVCNSGLSALTVLMRRDTLPRMDEEYIHDLSDNPALELVEGLTQQEEMFCLAFVEFSGNQALAYKSVFGDVRFANASAQELLRNQRVRDRIAQLNDAAKDAVIFSKESHMAELATIRDMAKTMGAVKVALAAEELRGKAFGVYAKEIPTEADKPGDRLSQLAHRLQSMNRQMRGEAVELQPKEVTR